MGMPVRIDDFLCNQAKQAAQAEVRTIAGQIEFWAKVGKAALRRSKLWPNLFPDSFAYDGSGTTGFCICSGL